MREKLRDLFNYYVGSLPLWGRLLAVSLIGILAGLIVFLIHISNFFSYVSDNPKTCINCHIMVPQYVSWSHSSHGQVTTCNDCHVPHDNVFHQYMFKAQDGMRHSTIFTLRGEPQAIIIKEAGVAVVQHNCIRCHKDLLVRSPSHKTDRLCWECHRETPHGRVRSLSSSPYARAPTTKSMIPEWLKQAMKTEKELTRKEK